jgi:DNA repair protein RecN (Recombination protein N)
LQVQGLGIIDRVEFELGPGFVVLTGETGAGKSLLVESLKLLTGQRSSSDMVRSGDDRLQVTGWFGVPSGVPVDVLFDELGIRPESEVVLRREVTSAGRTRCWLDDAPVTATTLQQLAPFLVSIHGQHEQHGLAEPAVQRALVDDFAGHGELRERVRSAFEDWQQAEAEADRLRTAALARRDRLDAIAFQLSEIDAVSPHEGEDDELRARRAVARHAVRLGELRTAALGRLSDDDRSAVVDALVKAERDVDEMAELGLPVGDLSARLAEARVVVEDVVRELQGYEGDIETDPSDLERLESRLHRLDELMLKYGSPLSAVIAHREALVEERSELDDVADRVTAAEKAAAEALAAYDRTARELDRSRRQAGATMLDGVSDVLEHLNMEGTRLEFEWAPRPDTASPLERDGERVSFDADGVEQCELLIAANPGETPRPMSKIASGGELSRLHLALRTVLRRRHADGELTLLFDEVDTGLGGGTAAALADLLADLARSDQVVVVTHLPQVAARADGHLRIEKIIEAGRAVTRVTPLEHEDREAEVARMLSGDETGPSARAHARALLER